jgi:hypothetical protein
MTWHQSIGHKGPVLRPRCIGTERARTKLLLFYSTLCSVFSRSQRFGGREGGTLSPVGPYTSADNAALPSFETSGSVIPTTRCKIPEDHSLPSTLCKLKLE